MISATEALRRACSETSSKSVPLAYSHVAIDVLPRGSRRWKRGKFQRNLATDGVSTFTGRREWQSRAMANGASAAFATIKGFATSMTATVLTNSGAAFPTSGNGLAGQWVCVGPNNAGTGSQVLGKIQSNTATALTVDQWWDPTSVTGAAGTTPNGTASYCVIPGQAPADMLAVTADVTAPVNTETSLISEATTNGFARAVATWGHSAGTGVYTLVKTFTATGSLTPANEANFGGALSTAGGVLPFKSAIGTPPALISGDTMQLTQTFNI